MPSHAPLRRNLLALLVCASLPSLAVAETAPATDAQSATTLDSISVIGRGEARQVQRVTAEDMKVLPPGSMQTLLAKLPNVDAQLRVLSAQELGTRADHFAWLKAPDAVADSFFIQLDENFHKTVDGTRRHPHNSAPVAGRP